MRWISRYPPAERQTRRQAARDAAMAARPPSLRQLAYLEALRHVGPPPVTMLDASQLIDLLTRNEVQK